jgi:hypothetical protein
MIIDLNWTGRDLVQALARHDQKFGLPETCGARGADSPG